MMEDMTSTIAGVPLALIGKLRRLHHPDLSHSLVATFSSPWDLKATHAQLIVSKLSTDRFTISRLLASAALSPAAADLRHATTLFSNVRKPTVSMYNTMFRCFSHDRATASDSIRCYVNMCRGGTSPDRITFPFVIKSASMVSDVRVGKGVHGHVLRFGLVSDVFVVNNLIGMYSGFGDLDSARTVFDECVDGVADVVSWTTLVTAYSNAGELGLARSYFDRMPEKNLVSWNSMIFGYARKGLKREARNLFDEMPDKNVASWSSMISGYTQCGLCKEALAMFKEMIGIGLVPNEPALVSAVSACSQLRALEQGEWVHNYVMEECKDKLNLTLGSALVDMYGKCGNISKAVQVFKEMPVKNAFSWNSMIVGLAMNGSGRQALTLFWKMKMAGITPNAITFIGVLSACSHSGLVDEGQLFFDLMTRMHDIRPMPEHYGCMVDLLGRAGLIKEAIHFMDKMPVRPHSGLLGAVVGACRIHGHTELGEELGKQLIEMEPQHSGRYALLHNLYAAARKWDDAALVSTLLTERGVVKAAGNSIVKEH